MDQKHHIVQERTSIMKSNFELKSSVSVQRKFRTDYAGRTRPSRLTIGRLEGTLSYSGHVENALKRNSGRPRSARTALNIENVRKGMEASSRKST